MTIDPSSPGVGVVMAVTFCVGLFGDKVFHVDIQVSVISVVLVISVVPPSTLCCIEYTFRWCPVIVLGNTFEKYIVKYDYSLPGVF